MYAAALGGGRYYPAPWERPERYGGGYGGGSLGELIGRQGALQAQRHLAGSEMLAQGFQQALGGVADYFTQRAEKKEMAKRDAATLAAVESWDGKDPLALFKSMQQVRGPQEALQYTNAVLSLRKGPEADPAKELAQVGQAAQFFLKLSPEMQAKGYPAFRQRYGGSMSKLGAEMPEAWDPQSLPVVKALGEQFGPKEERKISTLGQGQVAFDEATGAVVARGPEKPAESKVHSLSPGQRLVDEAGKVVAEAPPAPKEPATDPADRQMQWAIDPTTGEERLMTNAEIRKMGGGRPATADMRNKAEGRTFVKRSIDAIKDLSEKVITKRGVAQRALAAGRTVESVLGNDPEFRTYQDARKALAGNLAVAQQGSRPSDADIHSIWLPLVPDVFSDTDESRKMKWDLINTMSLPEEKRGGPRGGGDARPKSRAEFDKLPSGTYFIDPNGVRRRKP